MGNLIQRREFISSAAVVGAGVVAGTTAFAANGVDSSESKAKWNSLVTDSDSQVGAFTQFLEETDPGMYSQMFTSFKNNWLKEKKKKYEFLIYAYYEKLEDIEHAFAVRYDTEKKPDQKELELELGPIGTVTASTKLKKHKKDGALKVFHDQFLEVQKDALTKVGLEKAKWWIDRVPIGSPLMPLFTKLREKKPKKYEKMTIKYEMGRIYLYVIP